MTADQIKQILNASANGMTPDEIAEMFSDAENEGRIDALQATEDDDSDYAAERRAEMRGMGRYDFNDYARNDAGEYLNYM
jgi:hypothetical protein